MRKRIGVIAVLVSAVFFGIGPMFVAKSFDGGNNGANAAFVRMVFPFLVLSIAVAVKKVSLRLTKREFLELLVYVGGGLGLTGIFLMLGYDYAPISVVTVLNYIYPVSVALMGFLFAKEKFGKWKLSALILCIAGVICFFENEGGEIQLVGILFGLLSGIFYALYIFMYSRSVVSDMPMLKRVYYTNLFTGLVALVNVLATGTMNLHMTGEAWLYVFAASTCTSLIGVPLFQFGMKRLGGFTSSILSTFEPITTIFCGVLFLQESISWVKGIGCVLVLASVICVTMAERDR